MAGFNVKFNDGIDAKVTGIVISETYSGVLAGTLTVATHHILPRYLTKMMDVENGKIVGCFCLPPELVDEAVLMHYTEEQERELSATSRVGQCLKELNARVMLEIADENGLHHITVEWFLSVEEMDKHPMTQIVQLVVCQLLYKELQPFCEVESWAEL